MTFTATIHVVAPAFGTPGGTVVFADGPRVLGSVLLTSGRATLSTSALAIGSDAITGDYKGDRDARMTMSVVADDDHRYRGRSNRSRQRFR